MTYTFLRWVVGLLLRTVWRPTVVGREQVPRTGPVIIASNHLSFFDSVVIPAVLPRRVYFLAKSEYFRGDGLRMLCIRTFLRAMDAVPIERGGRREALAGLQAALAVLRSGSALGIYPEGSRSRDGRLYRGRTGVGWLAMAAPAPIVPVTLIGSDRIQPVGCRLPRIERMTIVFGEPVDPAPFVAQVAAGGAAGRARRELTDLVMDRIAATSPQRRAGRFNDPSSPAPAPS